MFRTVSYKLNIEKNSIELVYGYIPPIEIRKLLKKQGWRWNPRDAVWYIRYSEQALAFAKKQARETEKRQKEIDKMPVFYRKHCGCDEDFLPLLQEDVFHKYVKSGSLKSIALELLYEYVFEDALSLFRELYIQATKNKFYQKELLAITPKSLYSIKKDGSVSLRYIEKQNSNDIDRTLRLKQSSFWENLKIFGINLKPVDRIAYKVSNYRNNCLANNKPYYNAASVQERYLYSILNELTLNYSDSLTKIIKTHLQFEIEKIEADIGEKNYYILALYSLIINNPKQAECYLSQYVDNITAKQVILNVERKRLNKNFEFAEEVGTKKRYTYIRSITFSERDPISNCTTVRTVGFNEEDKLVGNHSILQWRENKHCTYEINKSKWENFVEEVLVAHNVLEWSQAQFEAGNDQILSDISYEVEFVLTDRTVSFSGGVSSKGVILIMLLLDEHFPLPRNAKYIIDQTTDDIWF